MAPHLHAAGPEESVRHLRAEGLPILTLPERPLAPGVAVAGGDSFQYASIYVERCLRTDGYIVHGVSTSTKPVSYGHICHACASWTDNSGNRGVNVCSPWKSWP